MPTGQHVFIARATSITAEEGSLYALRLKWLLRGKQAPKCASKDWRSPYRATKKIKKRNVYRNISRLKR